MGLVLAAVAGFSLLLVLWSLEIKAFDAMMITVAILVVGVAVRMLTPFLPGNRD